MNKIAKILITTILVISMAFPITILSSDQAVSRATYAYIGAMPNPVGVGQNVMLHVGISDPLNYAKDGFTDLTVIITKPDNSTETIGPFRTDSTGGTGTIYTPTQIGTYYLQTHFPAQWYNFTGFDYFWKPNLRSNIL